MGWARRALPRRKEGDPRDSWADGPGCPAGTPFGGQREDRPRGADARFRAGDPSAFRSLGHGRPTRLASCGLRRCWLDALLHGAADGTPGSLCRREV